MMIKTIKITLGVLMAFAVWSAVVMFMIVLLHLLVVGGFTVYHLVHF